MIPITNGQILTSRTEGVHPVKTGSISLLQTSYRMETSKFHSTLLNQRLAANPIIRYNICQNKSIYP